MGESSIIHTHTHTHTHHDLATSVPTPFSLFLLFSLLLSLVLIANNLMKDRVSSCSWQSVCLCALLAHWRSEVQLLWKNELFENKKNSTREQRDGKRAGTEAGRLWGGCDTDCLFCSLQKHFLVSNKFHLCMNLDLNHIKVNHFNRLQTWTLPLLKAN